MRAPPRVVAGLLMTGLVAASAVAPLAHLALVPHVTCPEHGELVHAKASRRGAAVTRATPAVSASPDREKAEHDDHCLASATPRTLSSPPAAKLCAAERQGQVSRSVERDGTHTVELLRLAPKASPPV